jgi:peptide/nickel transport system ATP-binding protein
MKDYIIQIKNLSVYYQIKGGRIKTLDNVNMGFERGKITALIGESGCGKSTLTNAILGVLPINADISNEAEILFNQDDLLKLKEEERRQFRWLRASMVFQAAQSAFNPTMRIEDQLMDSIFDHNPKATRKEARAKVLELLDLVRLNPERVLESYPHELSGGMRQRAIIAMSMILDPELIILDEPTTALDTITQSYVFGILLDIHKKRNLSMILITHDMAAASKLSENVVVMYGGNIMENCTTNEIFSSPKHPYSQGLINSIPFIDGDVATKKPIKGSPPDLLNRPVGCIFEPRCEKSFDLCLSDKPEPISCGKDRFAACHLLTENGGKQ